MSGRLGRQRKPETLQSFRQKRLQPWLDFVNSLPEQLPPPWQADSKSMDDILEGHAAPQKSASFTAASRFPGTYFFPLGVIFDRAQAARDFYAFAWQVTNVLRWIVTAWSNRDKWPGLSAMGPPSASLSLLPAQSLSMGQSGLLTILPDPAWMLLMQSLEGLEAHRLRRCPIADCGRFFYAARSNSGACHEHLALARVRRGRPSGQALKRQYEETRRTNALVRKGHPLAEAKAMVARRKRRATQ